MDKLIKFLDDLFERYNVAEDDIAQVGKLIADLTGELNMDGEEFEPPSVNGDGEDGYEDEEGAED